MINVSDISIAHRLGKVMRGPDKRHIIFELCFEICFNIYLMHEKAWSQLSLLIPHWLQCETRYCMPFDYFEGSSHYNQRMLIHYIGGRDSFRGSYRDPWRDGYRCSNTDKFEYKHSTDLWRNSWGNCGGDFRGDHRWRQQRRGPANNHELETATTEVYVRPSKWIFGVVKRWLVRLYLFTW